MKVVLVEWDDSGIAEHGWHLRDEAHGITRCRSVGFLWKANRKRIILVQSLNPDQWAGSIAIPRSAIRKMKRVR